MSYTVVSGARARLWSPGRARVRLSLRVFAYWWSSQKFKNVPHDPQLSSPHSGARPSRVPCLAAGRGAGQTSARNARVETSSNNCAITSLHKFTKLYPLVADALPKYHILM
ncbi:hypothetical protein EVAR_68196_1 [Eumeta japonica]|uniref:Uncharacterized protein n=1 Tax=Eumeta variegata TaxID=151549 RepID=A0A4C2A3B2_EUMVA|nr:hypothetical protein EVAR_68196_1 [Eumeta japonica]